MAQPVSRSARYLLVEPNPFASRLHVLLAMLSALSGERVSVIAPPRLEASHWDEHRALLSRVDILTVNGSVPLSGPRAAPLSILEFWPFVRTAWRGTRKGNAEHRTVLVFTALDDYLTAFAFMAPLIRLLRRRVDDLILIKYRVSYLDRSGRQGPRQRALAAATHWAVYASGARLVTFDERLLGHRAGWLPVEVVPDPWDGDFGPHHRAPGRAGLGLSETDFGILLVGRQDRRKGFDTAMRALRIALQRNDDVVALVVGPVAPEYKAEFGRLTVEHSGRVRHIPDFVPDSVLPDLFAAADVVLLPYASFFTSTSGVLARAAASGVPVVASEHGLIGHRVRAHRMGLTIPAGRPAELSKAIMAMSSAPMDVRHDLAEGARRFATTCNIDAFHRSFRRVVRLTDRGLSPPERGAAHTSR